MAAHDEELLELRDRVDCRTVLERDGWELDGQESTRACPKYRKGEGNIVLVTHGGKGWYDPLNGKRGDVLALAQHVWGGTLGHARKHLRPLAGIVPKTVPMRPAVEAKTFDAEEKWRGAHQLRPGSQAWAYLIETRGLPLSSVERALRAGALREGIYGTVWAMHRDAAARLTGWEMRGPRFKGFSKGGTKGLLRLGDQEAANRVAVTESAIDALSLASIEGWLKGTLYVSTGGGYGPEADEALRALLLPGVRLVAATDQGTGGELLAARLHELATACGAGYGRLTPPEAKDWNDQLRRR